MRAHMPRRGKTLADKMFIDRACSEEQWVMTGMNLGIRLVLCELARNHNKTPNSERPGCRKCLISAWEKDGKTRPGGMRYDPPLAVLGVRKKDGR